MFKETILREMRLTETFPIYQIDPRPLCDLWVMTHLNWFGGLQLSWLHDQKFWSEKFRGRSFCRLSTRTKNWIIPLAWWIIRLRKNQSPLLKKHVTKKPKVKEASISWQRPCWAYPNCSSLLRAFSWRPFSSKA